MDTRTFVDDKVEIQPTDKTGDRDRFDDGTKSKVEESSLDTTKAARETKTGTTQKKPCCALNANILSKMTF